MKITLSLTQAQDVATAIVNQITQLDRLSRQVVTDREKIDLAKQITSMVDMLAEYIKEVER